MAAKKKTTKKKTGGAKKSTKGKFLSNDIVDLGMLVIGLLGGKFVAKKIETFAAEKLTSIDAKTLAWLSGGVQLAGGIYGATMVKNPLLRGVMLGISANGAEVLEQNLGLLNGMGALSFPMLRGVDTYREPPRLGATPDVYRSPATVGRMPSMQAIYAGGGGIYG